MIRSSDQLLRRVERLRLRCGSLIDGKLVGAYDSTFKGEGVEFEETRPYQSGDDVRAIDWRVTARFSKPFVKLFRQQRRLTVHLIVDGSGSMRVLSGGRTPADVAAEVAGVLSLVATAEQDSVGLTLFTDRIEHTVEPRSGPSHASRLLRDVVCWKPVGRGTRLELPLQRLLRTQRTRSVVFVISDFLAPREERPLRALSALHDVIPVIIRHSSEERLPRCGMLRVRDPESGRWVWIDTMNAKQRRQWDQAAHAERLRLTQWFAKLGCLPLPIHCDDDIVAVLHHYFERRSQLR